MLKEEEPDRLIIGSLAFVVVRSTATAVLRGDPSAIARLDRAVHERILSGPPIVRVKSGPRTGGSLTQTPTS